MISIMIVDDEPFIRESFKYLIKWESIDCYIKHETYNGLEAYKKFEHEPVDIVITDIKMPIMNGLKLIEKIKKNYPATALIILSAYDDFHLVKNAFNLGASDYILKSELDEQQVLGVLEKVKQKLLQPSKTSIQKHMLCAQLFEDFFSSSKNKERIIEQIKNNKFIENDSIIFVLTIVVEPISYSEYINNSNCIYNYLPQLLKIIDQWPMVLYIGNKDEKFDLLVKFSKENNPSDIYGIIDSLFNTIKRKSEKKHSIVVSGGLSNSSSLDKNFILFFRQAHEACVYTFIKGKGGLIKYRSLEHIASDNLVDVENKIDVFKKLMLERRIEEINKNLNIYLIYRKNYKLEEIIQLKKLFELYYFYIEDFIENNKIYKTNAILLWQQKFKDYIYQYGDYKEYNEWFERVFKCLSGSVAAKSNLIHRANEYIYKYYKSDISLHSIANYLEVSDGYLSRKFKNEMGVSLTHYVTTMKMEYAVHCLQTKNIKVYELSESLGYMSPEHFSRTFKKITGKSPTHYLKKTD